MWKRFDKQSRPERALISLNRWRLVVAIVFLLSASLVYRLFRLQVSQGDSYTAMAANQQQVSSRLKPERGKIYFTDNTNGQEKLYPVATNKYFALLYAVPKEISDPKGVAEKLYKFFDEPRLLQEMATSTTASEKLSVASSTAEELISNYLKRLDRPEAVYDSLGNKKVDSDQLLKLYAVLASTPTTTLSFSDLELKNGNVYMKEGLASSTALRIPGIGFNLESLRYYPENDLGSHLLGFVSYADNEGRGRYGLEEFFNEELFGKYGFLKSEKGGQRNTIIVNDREYVKPENGADLILTIDRNVEYFACQKLKEHVDKHGATGGSVIVVKPDTGAIIAMCSLPDFDPNNYREVPDISHYNNPALLYQYEPGSVFKTITLSIAIDQGKISPSTTYKDEGQIMISGWPKPIRNSDFSTHGPHGIVDMNAVLENSLNTGSIFAMKQAGIKAFVDYSKNYGFGERTGVELGAESAGNIDNILSKKVREINAATASFGQGIAATPLQMIMAYQAIANHGVLMKPYVVKAMIKNNKREDIVPKTVRRVISEKTADTISAMLVNVVEQGHSKKAYIEGYYIGGKTGTAQVSENGVYSKDDYIHTFIGIAPIENPAFVMLTKIDNPKDVQYAEGSALPLWKEVADFMLKYYKVPKTRN
jgi:cell division protein FtsI/penicillin-binding protein 2